MMSKKRIAVCIALNSLLLIVLIRAIVNIVVHMELELPDYFNYLFNSLKLAEILCPMLLCILTFVYIIALFHSHASGNKIPRFIDAARLVLFSTQIAIMLIELCILCPYRGEFSIAGNNIYLFYAIPLMTIIAFIPTRSEYSVFGLLYSNILTVLYIGTIIVLSVLNVSENPYKFLNVMTQDVYKSIINIVIILAATTMTAGILMLLARPRGKDSVIGK